jgi:hypothetical protein
LIFFFIFQSWFVVQFFAFLPLETQVVYKSIILLFTNKLFQAESVLGPPKPFFNTLKGGWNVTQLPSTNVLSHCGEVVCWGKHCIEEPKLRIPFSSFVWKSMCLLWSKQQCVLVVDCCYKTIEFCKTSFIIRIPFTSDFECYSCLLIPFIMYFIYNSSFVILEDFGIWRDGLGSKLGFLDKAKCVRRWRLGLSQLIVVPLYLLWLSSKRAICG